MRSTGDEAGDVGDVGDQDRIDLTGDLGECGEVDRARDRRPATENDLRSLAQRDLANLVHVDPAALTADVVLDGVEPGSGRRYRPAVGEVPAHRQRHAHDGVAGAASAR